MKKAVVSTTIIIFTILILLHIIAFNFISGGISLPFIIKIIIDFAIGSALSIPIYWLFFVKLKYIIWWKKCLLHLLVFLAYILLWYELQLHILLFIGIIEGHESSSGRYWDYYFAGLYYIIILGSYQAFQFFIEKKQLRQREHELLILNKTSEINMLKAQIRPHFLFNTLNSIGASVPPENEKTRTLITLLADTFRYSLKASMNEYVFLSEEIDFIEALLLLEKERYADRLQYDILVEDACKDILIAPLLIQPLVENAIEHGISPVPAGGAIKISVSSISANMHIQVTNTGSAYKDCPSDLFKTQGVGLKNLRDRLKQIYNGNLEINTNNPDGLTFCFMIPAMCKNNDSLNQKGLEYKHS